MTLQEQQLHFLAALIFIGMFMVMIIIQIISVIYDIKKQTRNEEDQIIKRIKNIIILLLLATVIMLLPLWGKDKLSIWEALIKALK